MPCCSTSLFPPTLVRRSPTSRAIPRAMLLAGGTLLMPAVNTETTGITSLISTRRLGLDDIAVDGDRATIGAAVTLADVGTTDRLAFLRPGHRVDRLAADPQSGHRGRQSLRAAAVRRFRRGAPGARCRRRMLAPEGERAGAVAEHSGAGGVAAAEIVTEVAFTICRVGIVVLHQGDAAQNQLGSDRHRGGRRHNRATGGVHPARIALGGAGPRPVRARSVEAGANRLAARPRMR